MMNMKDTKTEGLSQGQIRLALCCILTLGLIVATTLPAAAQGQGSPAEDWRYIGGDVHHTRYSPLDQINGDNFEDLEVAWVWRGDNYGPSPDYLFRSIPIKVGGLLYTVAGRRRTVIAIDPGSGETIWTYREPNTTRYERGMRNNYGKGVAYGEVDGRGVIYYTSPRLLPPRHRRQDGPTPSQLGTEGTLTWLPQIRGRRHASRPGEGLGTLAQVGLQVRPGSWDPPGARKSQHLVATHSGQWCGRSGDRPRTGLLPDPAVRTSRATSRATTPRPESTCGSSTSSRGLASSGHETWENDIWKTIGDVSSWAPMSADPELGLVYIPTNPPTLDFYGGFRPGDNLFGTSILALDVQTGKRNWHFQFVHHDIWNFDTPTAPIVMDVNVDGRPTPIVVQTTKQALAYTFNRKTGKPIWPIEERPVPQSEMEKLSPTQPFPTWPLPYDMQGLTEDDLIDFTPELRKEALEIVKDYKIGPIFNPPIPPNHPSGKKSFVLCPSGSTNIYGPTGADPETGILYVSSRAGCRSEEMVAGKEKDEPDDPKVTGKTIAKWVVANRGGFRGPQGLPMYKPPYSRITAHRHEHGEAPLVHPQRRHARVHQESQGPPRRGRAHHRCDLLARHAHHQEPAGTC